MAMTPHSEKVARYVETLESRDIRAKPPLSASANMASPSCPPHVDDSTPIRDPTTFGLVELLLKDQPQFDRLARSPQAQRELIPRLVSVGLVGYVVFASVLSVVYCCAKVWPELIPLAVWLENPGQSLLRVVPLAEEAIWTRCIDGSMFELMAAFALGLIGAIGICLPSFYFYSLLAGIRTTMLEVTTTALKGLASGAIALFGILPIYLAGMLGLIVLDAPVWAIDAGCLAGLVLPFVAGLYGTTALYSGFLTLADTLPDDRRCRRTCFLRRLLLAWSGCYTAVTPVMIFALWEYLSR
jgi:hypothetical protein